MARSKKITPDEMKVIETEFLNAFNHPPINIPITNKDTSDTILFFEFLVKNDIINIDKFNKIHNLINELKSRL